MASTGVNSGTLRQVYWGASPAVISNAISGEWTTTMDTRETTNKDSGASKSFLPTRYSGQITGEYHFAEDASSNPFDTLWDDMIAGTARTVEWTTNVSGDIEYSASGYITSLAMSSPDADNETFTMTIQLTGAISSSTVT